MEEGEFKMVGWRKEQPKFEKEGVEKILGGRLRKKEGKQMYMLLK